MNDEYDPANPYLWGVQAQVYTGNAALPGDPNVYPDTAPSELSPGPIETEEQKRDRLWRAVVSSSQGNG
jgi:hypothetical protein